MHYSDISEASNHSNSTIDARVPEEHIVEQLVLQVREKVKRQRYSLKTSRRGPNISLILAVSKKGPIHHKAIIGSFKNDTYQEFLMEVSLKLPNGVYYLIHDNASIHSPTISTTDLHEIVNLPPYSPFLNPIETVFSQLKSKIRTRLTASSDL